MGNFITSQRVAQQQPNIASKEEFRIVTNKELASRRVPVYKFVL